ncbi:hypothetical protein PAHAL_2G243900 [Panicum hallii]|uniref:Uncharacterized protein n=1 Tax=Panicum hallii TaxID=206008 RepID=A0A2T8KQE1_9POAL|nr:hypothetical protein PAHAL_2G243900 [Panicum hallii]
MTLSEMMFSFCGCLLPRALVAAAQVGLAAAESCSDVQEPWRRRGLIVQPLIIDGSKRMVRAEGRLRSDKLTRAYLNPDYSLQQRSIDGEL